LNGTHQLLVYSDIFTIPILDLNTPKKYTQDLSSCLALVV